MYHENKDKTFIFSVPLWYLLMPCQKLYFKVSSDRTSHTLKHFPLQIDPPFTHLSGTFCSLFQPPAIIGPTLSGVAVVGDEEVVEEDVGGHGPELEPQGAEGSHLERLQILEERRVGDLPRLPDALTTQTCV